MFATVFLALMTAASMQGKEPPEIIASFKTLDACQEAVGQAIVNNRDELIKAQIVPVCLKAVPHV